MAQQISCRGSRRLALAVAALALGSFAPRLHADIYQWEWADPNDPSQGKRQSAILCPGGAGLLPAPSADFASRDLSKAYLIGANLTAANLRQTLMINADLTNAQLWTADLHDTDLTNALITGTNLDDATANGLTVAQFYSTANYKSKDLRNTRFAGNDATGWNLAGQDLSGANWFGTTLVGAALTGATLANTDLRETHLADADLTDAWIAGAKLGTGYTAQQIYSTASYKAHNLRNVDFGYSPLNPGDLSGWNFANQDLSGASLSAVMLTGTDLNGAQVAGAIFAFATGRGFASSQLYSTASYKARDLRGITLTGNDLTAWNFAGQNLTRAIFVSATTSQTDFTGADLRSAGINSDQLAAAITRNAILPNGTVNRLALAPGETLLIRNYDGNVPIKVLGSADLAEASALQVLLSPEPWGSTISFDSGLVLNIAGDLRFTLASDTEPSALVGKSFQIFDWTGADRHGQFNIVTDLPLDTSQLYTTGLVTVVPEPAAISLLAATGIFPLLMRRTRRLAQA